jgi:hypothetical protein
MATATKNGFDAETFRNLLARVESNHPAEAETAFRKAMLMCVENTLSFGEAIAEAYGRDDGASQLEEENAKLREEVERRKQGGDKLADALDQAKEKIAELEKRELHEGPLWSVRKVLLILMAVIAARIVLFIALGEGPSGDGTPRAATGFAPWLANLLLVLSGAWLLAQWHRGQQAAEGWGQLVMKWGLLGPGLFMSASIFFGGPPWDASMFDRAPVPALVVAMLTVLLVLSKFTERIAERVPDACAAFSLRRAFSWVFGWFF